MKTLRIIAALGIVLASCKNESKTEEKVEEKTEVTVAEKPQNETDPATINWEEAPKLDNIGNFPFFTAPKGLKINFEKNGATEIFSYEKMQIFNGKSTFEAEGKLAMLVFDGADGETFNQRLFDKSVYDYVEKIGAKLYFKGIYPEDESLRKTLSENLYNGKNQTSGLMEDKDSPFSIYYFKNNGKNYIVTLQSNSAQGNIFVMELEAFEQTMTKYTSAQMKKDIDANGKAILNINFDTDKATLQPEGQKIVDEIVTLLKENPSLKISIEGHTDNSGSADRNKKLSAERATTVLNSLTSNGIEKSRLKAAGFGAEKPLVANDSEENKAKNRRVELLKF